MLKTLNYIVPIFGVALIGYAISTHGEVRNIPQSLQNQSTELWQVTSVADADTITVVRDGETRKIRFCGIDAPETAHRAGETSQPVGDAAKKFVEDAIARYNGQVGIEFVERDRYGRWVGEVFLNVGGTPPEVFLNSQLILNGYAWPYKQYWDNCPNQMVLEAAEEMANQSGAGIWLNPENMPPWEWRQR